MARRSITLFPILEHAVRELQADLLLKLKQDVSFTEALNFMVLRGWLDILVPTNEWPPDTIKTFFSNTNLQFDSLLDILRDELVNNGREVPPSLSLILDP